MDIKYTKDGIALEKELNALDRLTIDFTSVLNQLKIRYVVVSGYVSILFGRSRSSEDIDIIVDKLSFEKFEELWYDLYKDFECINTENVKEAYTGYLMNKNAIRFSRKKEYIPNIEVKFPDTDLNQLDLFALSQRKKVILNDNTLFISPLELQIPFKFFLGSEKDIEDAVYLYEIFKNKLEIKLMRIFIRKLKIEELFNKHIK